jgi:hypothetical protein
MESSSLGRPAGCDAGVAQLVEQRIRNAKVGSSTLLAGTIGKPKADPVSAFVVSGPNVASGTFWGLAGSGSTDTQSLPLPASNQSAHPHALLAPPKRQEVVGACHALSALAGCRADESSPLSHSFRRSKPRGGSTLLRRPTNPRSCASPFSAPISPIRRSWAIWMWLQPSRRFGPLTLEKWHF